MIPSDEAWPDPPERAGGHAFAPDNGAPDIPEADSSFDRVGRLKKAATAFRTISEVADDLHVPQHVLRFWETRFPQVKPLKRGGGRRYYRPDDVVLLRRISDLLYVQGYTIKGVQRLLIEGDGSLHGELPLPDPAEVPDHVPDLPDAEEQGDPVQPAAMFEPASSRKAGHGDGMPPGDHRPDPGDDLRVLREVFRETLSVILAELEAIRRQLPI